MSILAVDIGTTSLKMGVYGEGENGPVLSAECAKPVTIRTYNDGAFSDVDPAQWQAAFRSGCRDLRRHLGNVDVIALSGTTPGLTAMDAQGRALYPAILMLDLRSRAQAAEIIARIGPETLLRETGNLPVAGGCSLASILWLRDHEPEIYRSARLFGHSNTFFAAWLTGASAIDPSSASLTALYNTVRDDLSWNEPILETFGLSADRLPPLKRAEESVGRVRSKLAAELGLSRRPQVLIGGNDAVLAAYSVGINHPGDVINVNGTCEITLVCLPRCMTSPRYNVRVHVVAQRWLTLHVLNAGGAALEWFRTVFCRDMTADGFYREFIPAALDVWVDGKSKVRYVPYLMGSRYSLRDLKAEFRGLTRETSREEMLAALVRGCSRNQRGHLREIGRELTLNPVTHITGGAVNEAIIRAKQKWYRKGEYRLEQQSSLRGAALLGLGLSSGR